MNREERDGLMAGELMLIRHAGELPEVALHGSLYHLCEDAEGPGLALSAEEMRALHEAVIGRYRAMLRRDLHPANRGRSVFRGLQRAWCNWRRLARFCDRIACPAEAEALRPEAAQALDAFLRVEIADLRAGHPGAVNCSREELLLFARALGMAALPEGWEALFEVIPPQKSSVLK